MDHVDLGSRFKFDKTGTTKNATFTGPVMLFENCLVLVPKRVTTENAGTAAFFFGLIGSMIASLFSSMDRITFPYSATTCSQLPAALREAKKLKKLKDTQQVVIVRREQIRGYKTSFFGGFTLICEGESIWIHGAQRRLKAAFDKYGYSDNKAND